MNESQILKLSPATAWRIGKDLLIRLLIPEIGVAALVLHNEGHIDFFTIIIVFIVFLFIHSPTLYLYFEYIILSFGKFYEVSSAGIRVNNGSLIPIEDFDHIELVLSLSRSNKDIFDYIGLRNYYYALIFLKNKRAIGPITCLQSKHLDKDLELLKGTHLIIRASFIPDAWPNYEL